jgi:hypothetical protein
MMHGPEVLKPVIVSRGSDVRAGRPVPARGAARGQVRPGVGRGGPGVCLHAAHRPLGAPQAGGLLAGQGPQAQPHVLPLRGGGARPADADVAAGAVGRSPGHARGRGGRGRGRAGRPGEAGHRDPRPGPPQLAPGPRRAHARLPSRRDVQGDGVVWGQATKSSQGLTGVV